MATQGGRSNGSDAFLKGFALLLAAPSLGLALWAPGALAWFAENVFASGAPVWSRLLMLGTVLIPVSAGFGLARALSERWVPAGAWFLLLGLGAACWGPEGRLVAVVPVGLGMAMLIRGMEARPRRSARPPLASRPSSVRVWDRGFAVIGSGVAVLSVIAGREGVRVGYEEMITHPDAGVVMYLSLGVAALSLMAAVLLWSNRRAPGVLLEVLAAAAAFTTPHFLDTWPYGVAPGSPQALFGTKVQVLGTILLGFAGVVFVWSLILDVGARRPSGHIEEPAGSRGRRLD